MEIKTLTVNGQTFTVADPDALHRADIASLVSFDPQQLTAAQKAQARENIEAMPAPDGTVINFQNTEMKNICSIELEYIKEENVLAGRVTINAYEDCIHETLNRKTGVLELSGGVDEDNEAIIRRVAPGVRDDDAATVGQLNEAVGNIETALDSIIAIQESLMGVLPNA